MGKTAILFSGGLDSTCIAKWLKPEIGYFVDYGQISAQAEHKAASVIAGVLGIHLIEVTVDLHVLGQGLLTGKSSNSLSDSPEWWPFRNQALITLAAMRAISDGVDGLIVGTVNSDASRHADGKPDFVRKMDELLAMQEGALRVSAPAIDMSTAEVAQRSGATDRLLLRTFSCHRGNFHCGYCPGCRKRAEFFGW